VSLQPTGDLRKLASLAIVWLARSFCEAACGVKHQSCVDGCVAMIEWRRDLEMLLRLLFALVGDETNLVGAGGYAERDGQRQN
jgi:hypothetical protein